MILVNFKTYRESTGENAIRLAKAVWDVCDSKSIASVVCPQSIDIREVSAIRGNHEVWMQHADLTERGRATGWLPLEVVKDAGAQGILINHSEHKLPMNEVEGLVKECKILGLKSLIFAGSLEEAVFVSRFRPDYVGYEPPELVASKETSVSRAKPDIIEKVVKAVPDTKILVGAGVKDKNDVKVSLNLGAKGICIASGVILAKDQRLAMEDLAAGFENHFV